jgi:hypothetical protein
MNGGFTTVQENPRRIEGGGAIVLAAALLQGGILYALHRFPPPDDWLPALLAVTIFTPLTAQLLAAGLREGRGWAGVMAMTLAFFFFGWYWGHAVGAVNWGEFFLALIVPWLIALPFAQARFDAGKWSADPRRLFSHAWRNVAMLAGAIVFTGFFWFLLLLCQSLFSMLNAGVLSRLLIWPPFILPVTALAFGYALAWLGSTKRMARRPR